MPRDAVTETVTQRSLQDATGRNVAHLATEPSVAETIEELKYPGCSTGRTVNPEVNALVVADGARTHTETCWSSRDLCGRVGSATYVSGGRSGGDALGRRKIGLTARGLVVVDLGGYLVCSQRVSRNPNVADAQRAEARARVADVPAGAATAGRR
jgi:hypothetical protein